MLLFESMLPYDRRQGVAALIRSATRSCEERRRFYAYAAKHGLVAAADTLEGDLVVPLKEELDDIIGELLP